MKTRKLSKQILSVVLTLVMVLTMLPMTASAAGDKTFDLGNGFTLTIHGGQVKHTWGSHTRYHDVIGVQVYGNQYSYGTATYFVKVGLQFYCDHENYQRMLEDPFTIRFKKSDNPFKCNETVSITDTRDYMGEYQYTLKREATSHDCTATTTEANCVAPKTTTYSRCALCYHTPDPVTEGSVDSKKHSWGEWKFSGNNTHTRTCSLNSSHTETGNCSGDPVTCMDDVTCSVCQNIMQTAIGHSCSYTKTADNVLTETCSNGCGHSAKATLTAENKTYTGSAITDAAVISYDEDWQGERKQPTAANYAHNTDAGTATVSITVEGNELTEDFSILPASLDKAQIALEYNSISYDGQNHKPKYTVTLDGFGTLTEGRDYKAVYLVAMATQNGVPTKWFGDGTKDAECIKPGIYGVVILGLEGGNFAPSKPLGVFAAYTIGKDVPGADDFLFTPPYLLTYDGSTKQAEIEPDSEIVGMGDITVNYYRDGEKLENGSPVNAGTYQVKIDVSEGKYYTAATGISDASWTFTIKKADQEAPNVGKTDETFSAKNDGKITGVDSAMEYRKDGESTYTAITGTEVTGLGDGTYFVRYKEIDNYNASPETKVTVAAGRKLTVTVPENQVGYTMTTTTPEVDYFGNIRVEFKLHEGYSMTEDFQIYNGNEPVGFAFINGVYIYGLNFVVDDFNFTVKGVADITPPVAEIQVKDNKWNRFWNNITFGLFFKETQDVTIIADDKGSGVDKIYYYFSDRELELDEVRTINDWQEYNGTFKINPDNRYVIYAKAVDKDGNPTYINSEGIVLDDTAPVLYGIEDGGVYHGDKVFKAMDENFLKIEVDGVDITDTTEGDAEFKIAADNAEHTVTVTDKAGNVTEYKITVYKKYMVTYTDGDGSSYEKNFNYGEVITIPTNEFFKDTFRKTGYTVKEWQGYTEGMTMPLSNLTFTAVYAPCEYTVTFDQNGGEVISPITVTFGEKYGSLPSSAITGLSGGNKNWYLVDADGNVTETNIKNLTLVSTARDHKLFIKRNVLAPSVSVALTVPGGISDGYQYYIPGASQRVLTATVGNMNTDILNYTYQWYKDGTLIEGAISNVLTLDGNVSDSGTYKVEVTVKLKDGTNIVVGSDTATASKEQKVKIMHATNTLSYDANGGEGGPQSSYTGGTGLNISKDVPTRMHYDFIGWNTASDGSGDSYTAEELYTFAEDNGNGGCVVTLYAQWKPVKYTVTYKVDGEPIFTEKVEYGKDANLPTVPQKDGYIGKWDGDGKNIMGDTTISAVYTAIPVVTSGDNANLWVLFALLFVSGAGIFGITFTDRKKWKVKDK